MSQLVSWPRPHFTASGGKPFILFHVFGEFGDGLQPSRQKHRVGGVPSGVDVNVVATDDENLRAFLENPFIEEQLDEDPALGEAVRNAPSALLLQGEIDEPDTLDYLRDVVGLVCAALDAGGVAVLDMQTLTVWSPDHFRETFLESEGPQVHEHVAILGSREEDGRGLWLHTRGMRKFGRPDISVRNVPEAAQQPAATLVSRLIESMAFGAVVPEGQPVKMALLPAGLVCRHGGDLEDPDFNNVHVEIRFP